MVDPPAIAVGDRPLAALAASTADDEGLRATDAARSRLHGDRND
jgi:hypothetical protein